MGNRTFRESPSGRSANASNTRSIGSGGCRWETSSRCCVVIFFFTRPRPRRPEDRTIAATAALIGTFLDYFGMGDHFRAANGGRLDFYHLQTRGPG